MPTSKLQRFQFLLLLAQRVHDVGLGNWCFFHGDWQSTIKSVSSEA